MKEQNLAISDTPNLQRRKFLTQTANILGGLTLINAPWVHTATKPTLRVIGTHATLQEPIRQQVMQDLGINIIFEAGGNTQVLQKASMRPETFDVYEQWSNSINILWDAEAIQPIEWKRIPLWDEINSLTKMGRLSPHAPLGLGDRPYELLYVQNNRTLSNQPSNYISFVPYVHNVDSFGYNTQIIPRGQPYDTESWSWLLDDKWRGKVALVNDPTIGLFDMALAAQATGLLNFKDLGDLTKPELDQLFALLISKKQLGHFSGFWDAIPVSAEYMLEGRSVISSMFEPAAVSLNAQGMPVVYAAPREGYRAWHGVLCLSKRTKGGVRDAAYEYMNWWLSGWPGAYVARQGYYISVPDRVKPYMSDAEWDYWYQGKVAVHDLVDNRNRIIVRAGERRNGGSYWERFNHVAVWNTVMASYDYSLPRWNELLLA